MATPWTTMGIGRVLDHCLEDSQEAWFELHARIRRPLERFIERRLTQYGLLDHSLVQEICQLVWLSLLAQNKRRLRQYQSSHQSLDSYLTDQRPLDGYLAKLAWSQIAHHIRWQERQDQRTAEAGAAVLVSASGDAELGALVSEIAEVMPPGLQTCWQEHLGEPGDWKQLLIPSAQARKRRSRLRKWVDGYLAW